MTGIEIPALSIPKVALVTGGNSGIGKATAARLAAMGSVVVVGYNSRRAQAEEVVGWAAGQRASRHAHRDRRSGFDLRGCGGGGPAVRAARCAGQLRRRHDPGACQRSRTG